MFQLDTERLIVVTAPLEAVERRLADVSEQFQADVALRDGVMRVTFPPEWPGDALVLLPMELEARRRDPSDVGWGGTVVDRAERVAVGGIGAKGQPDAEGKVEIGYGINPSYWGRGYATEAVGALTEWLLGQPGVRTVVAETRQDNRASIRVLEKLGFARVGERVDDEDGPLFIWARRHPES